MRKLQVKLSVFRSVLQLSTGAVHQTACLNNCFATQYRGAYHSCQTLAVTPQALVHPQRHSPKRAQEEEPGPEQNILPHQGH